MCVCMQKRRLYRKSYENYAQAHTHMERMVRRNMQKEGYVATRDEDDEMRIYRCPVSSLKGIMDADGAD